MSSDYANLLFTQERQHIHDTVKIKAHFDRNGKAIRNQEIAKHQHEIKSIISALTVNPKTNRAKDMLYFTTLCRKIAEEFHDPDSLNAVTYDIGEIVGNTDYPTADRYTVIETLAYLISRSSFITKDIGHSLYVCRQQLINVEPLAAR